MQKVLAFFLALSFCFLPLASGARVRSVSPIPPAQDDSGYQPYTDDQLDNLLAPIALYPDPLLAQVLVAATFPDQIDQATRWVRAYGQNEIDDQPWDVSVAAVAHYPTVLQMLDDNLDWTTAVGQAYVYQSTDVMASIQRLRAMAQAQGNLVDSPQQQVVVQDGYIAIWPANPAYLYVPVYDPSIVYFRPVYYSGTFIGFSFGPAFAIGVWLNLDCDWGHRRVYYTGWQGGGWIARSRPRIRITQRYVDPRYRTIEVDRRVVQRPVNYQDLTRYQNVHREANFEDRDRGRQRPPQPEQGRVPNKIIDRNIPPNQRYDQFRGRQQPTQTPPLQQFPQPPRTTPPPVRQPERQPIPQERQPIPQQRQPIPQQRQPMPEQRQPMPPQREPYTAPPQRQPMPAPVQRPPVAQPQPMPPPSRPPNAFGRGDSQFDSRVASQRGQQSRQQMNQKPAARPASKPQQRPRHPGGR